MKQHLLQWSEFLAQRDNAGEQRGGITGWCVVKVDIEKAFAR